MVYVISDLHGYPLVLFKKLLRSAGFSKEDRLYIIGDVVDRNGDGGIRMLQWIMEQPNVRLLLGNHESMLLSCDFLFYEDTDMILMDLDAGQTDRLSIYMWNGGDVTARALRTLTSGERLDIYEYLKKCPLYENVSVGDQNFILVHSGFSNFSVNRRLSDYTSDELLWSRPSLSDRYFEDKITVFGHTPTKYYGENYRGQIIRTKTWIDIDVGAGSGEKPVLLRLDDDEEFRPD